MIEDRSVDRGSTGKHGDALGLHEGQHLRDVEHGDRDDGGALEQARKSAPDIIITEILVPALDGLTLCRELRSESSVAIILLTLLGADTDRIVGLDGRRRLRAKAVQPA